MVCPGQMDPMVELAQDAERLLALVFLLESVAMHIQLMEKREMWCLF